MMRSRRRNMMILFNDKEMKKEKERKKNEKVI